MLIPAWHLAVLWFLYAFAYFYRYYLKDRRYKYIVLGKGIARLVLALAYIYLSFWNVAPGQAQILIRWSLTSFLLVELVFIAQEWWMWRQSKTA